MGNSEEEIRIPNWMVIKRNIFITNFSLTALSQVLITILNIIILKILSNQIPEEGLGVYLIVRRLIALIFPVVTINLSMSLSRFVSFDQNKAEKYFVHSFLFLSIVCLMLVSSLPLIKTFLSKALFGSNDFVVLILPIIIFLYSNSFQILCVGFFRGKQNYLLMNLIDVLFWIGAISLLSILFFIPDDFIRFLYYYLIFYAIIAFVINCFILIRYSDIGNYLRSIVWKSLRAKKLQLEKQFFKYGASRIPSGFFLGAVFFAPIFVATNYFDLKLAAYVGVIISIIRMVQLTGFPFNIIFLPKFSFYQASNNKEIIRNNSQIILEFLFTLPFLLGLFCAFFSPELILLWFGAKYNVVVPYLIFISPFIGFLIGYIFITGILDGSSNYPYVNFITAISMLGVILILALTIIFSWDLWGITIALSAGLLILGISSIYILVKKQNLKIISKKNITAISWFIFVLVIFLFYNANIITNQIYLSIVIKFFISIIILVASYILYKKLDYQWIHELKLRIKEIGISK